MKAAAEAEKVPVLEPAGMVREAGTVRFVVVEFRLTVPPPVPLRTTVQVLEALGATVAGLQAIELTVVVAVTPTMPPVAVMLMGSAAGEAPMLLLRVTGRAVAPARVIDRVATTPSEMVLAFNPDATQV